ncbi:hypothetical protein CCR75_005372 [Bremia lactucae]|uniref:Uncharacterized protein n=1 Tax=Bremia lactucae TaxID=4779 RepID=A0A976FF06_BRELC|nr:hypothetical protein CCR75_005372 [Bremia lactucae]
MGNGTATYLASRIFMSRQAALEGSNECKMAKRFGKLIYYFLINLTHGASGYFVWTKLNCAIKCPAGIAGAPSRRATVTNVNIAGHEPESHTMAMAIINFEIDSCAGFEVAIWTGQLTLFASVISLVCLWLRFKVVKDANDLLFYHQHDRLTCCLWETQDRGTSHVCFQLEITLNVRRTINWRATFSARYWEDDELLVGYDGMLLAGKCKSIRAAAYCSIDFLSSDLIAYLEFVMRMKLCDEL